MSSIRLFKKKTGLQQSIPFVRDINGSGYCVPILWSRRPQKMRQCANTGGPRNNVATAARRRPLPPALMLLRKIRYYNFTRFLSPLNLTRLKYTDGISRFIFLIDSTDNLFAIILFCVYLSSFYAWHFYLSYLFFNAAYILIN